MDKRVGIVFVVQVEDTAKPYFLGSIVRVFNNEEAAVEYANMKNEAVGNNRYNYFQQSYGVFK